MNDVMDSRVREAILPDHSGSVACSNVNMMSVDSGVETGNDSNDGSTVQQESQQQQQTSSQVISHSDVTAVDSSVELTNSYTTTMNMYNCCALMPPLFDLEDTKPILKGFEMKWNTHKIDKSLRYPGCYYKINKAKDRFLLHKSKTHTLMSNDWQAERIQRRMRLAASVNNVTLMKRLLEFGVSPNSHDEHGRTPLHISACRGYTEIVRLLLENGADPNQRDCIGNTPLHLATVNNRLSVVMSLLTAGTDVLALDSYGYNPLQLAKTKLRMLQRNCNNEDMLRVKKEMHNVINMLMAYLQRQKNMQEQVETLSNFCSRLSLSNTSYQVQDDVKDLLASINALNIAD